MIHQNSFGKPTYSTINYLYRADGTKLRKTFSSSSPRGSTSTRITDYLDGFQYSYFEGGGNCITCRTENAYEAEAYRGILDPGVIPEWKLDFVATAEGFYSFTENRYIYQYRDHLGNTRVTFAKNSAGAPEIIDTNNYYPFGLNHISGSFGTSNFGSFYSYKYNGKELQETGMYDYGARMMMPDLGRWGAMDAMSEKYSSWSPYNYAINNPVMVIDPDGNDIQPLSEAQQAFKNYVATMSTGTETSGGNIFTGFGYSPFGEYDWVRRKDGSFYWDNEANNQKSTKLGETYMGKSLRIGMDSYIDRNQWDGPNPWFDVSGSKLQTDIWISSEENAKGELTGISTIIRSKIMTNKGGFKGVKINSMPDIESSKNFIDKNGEFIGFNITVEKHAQVPEFEKIGLNLQGYGPVNVAQRIDVNYVGKNLNISFKTDVFPSASAGIIGAGGSFKLMQYDQPSYRETHSLFKNGVRKPYLYPRN
ncbi:RHS repeat-associated core domain-containing protein [Chryseobacterium sp. MEBOG06]|uniref:RHS repeat domain-containing protein n=1 Tax=Chryseobacterium sp. MEBOG06 TaxID=2879938 RepID=UPI001F293090|nr:RHS repeat-associated core domain-containing protein [Chryseobacterium sp. MEBOG06]UKB85378.1 RHS repeat-associated core domain-containing protein [Chryseobacterium sp. MEBOG06]